MTMQGEKLIGGIHWRCMMTLQWEKTHRWDSLALDGASLMLGNLVDGDSLDCIIHISLKMCIEGVMVLPYYMDFFLFIMGRLLQLGV